MVLQELAAANAQLRDQAAAAAAANANLDFLRERCARLEGELAAAQADAEPHQPQHSKLHFCKLKYVLHRIDYVRTLINMHELLLFLQFLHNSFSFLVLSWTAATGKVVHEQSAFRSASCCNTRRLAKWRSCRRACYGCAC